MADWSGHHTTTLDPNEVRDLSPVRGFVGLKGVVGVVAMIVAIILALRGTEATARFFFAYLTAFAFVLSISLGALFFVLIQHVTSAGWSVTVRRVAEVLAAGIPFIALMAIPLIFGIKYLYPGTALDSFFRYDPEHPVHLSALKINWLSAPWLITRLVIYFVVWIIMARAYHRLSVKQDVSGDPQLSMRLKKFSAPCVIIFALTVTFASFDLFMALDPQWFSTIFGVYFFAGCVVSSVGAMILVFSALQARGVMASSVNTEHYHDLGKLMFGFVFFWGYIAFSQFMLIWYASLPEEVVWFHDRGATTAAGGANQWTNFILVLLVGNFILPFLGLLSRHVKRSRGPLTFWAIWLLILHYIDLCWLIMPSFTEALTAADVTMMILCLIGLGGIYLALCARVAGRRSLVPTQDPRLGESLEFHNA